MLAKLISCLSGSKRSKRKRFEKILQIASNIARENPEALKDYVRLLGRKLQSDYMCRAVSWLDEERVPNLKPKIVWFDEFAPVSQDGSSLYDLKVKSNASHTINLAADIILPWPWNLERVAGCISCIGTEKAAGPWKQDLSNHKVEYWLPFGIAWVHGGNHSIMAGIVQGQGSIETNCVYDLSSLFKHVWCDGAAFLRSSDNQVIQQVTELEFAAIFEVGRVMHERGIGG